MHGLTQTHASALHQHRLGSYQSFLDGSFFWARMLGIIGSLRAHRAAQLSGFFFFIFANGRYNRTPYL